MERKERFKSISKKRRRRMNSTKSETITISTGLVKQLIEQLLESVGRIEHDDHVFIELPWKEDTIPLKLSTWKEAEVHTIRHG
jgi:hypothetical protein